MHMGPRRTPAATGEQVNQTMRGGTFSSAEAEGGVLVPKLRAHEPVPGERLVVTTHIFRHIF